jgi:hypothetical protein
MTDGFEPPATEGWQSFYLIKNVLKIFCYKMKQLFGVWKTPDLEAVL